MPGVVAHLHLADQIRTDWNRRGHSPIDLSQPDNWAAFQLGAIGPDAGYLSLGSWWISDLAHYVSPADLTRCLLRHATEDIETAFALGWASHVIVDVTVHPLINRLVGKFIHETDAEVPYAADPASHVRVELGLDMHLRNHRPTDFTLRSTELQQSAARLLSKALDETYQMCVSPTNVLATVSKAVNRAEWLVHLYDTIGRRPKQARDIPLLAVYRMARLSSAFSPQSVIYGFTHPIYAEPAVNEQFLSELQNSKMTFHAEQENDFATLRNMNLDTGRAATEPYPPTQACHDWLSTQHRPRPETENTPPKSHGE